MRSTFQPKTHAIHPQRFEPTGFVQGQGSELHYSDQVRTGDVPSNQTKASREPFYMALVHGFARSVTVAAVALSIGLTAAPAANAQMSAQNDMASQQTQIEVQDAMRVHGANVEQLKSALEAANLGSSKWEVADQIGGLADSAVREAYLQRYGSPELKELFTKIRAEGPFAEGDFVRGQFAIRAGLDELGPVGGAIVLGLLTNGQQATIHNLEQIDAMPKRIPFTNVTPEAQKIVDQALTPGPWPMMPPDRNVRHEIVQLFRYAAKADNNFELNKDEAEKVANAVGYTLVSEGPDIEIMRQSVADALGLPPVEWVSQAVVVFEDADFIYDMADKRVDAASLPEAVKTRFDALKSEFPGASFSAFAVEIDGRTAYALRADKGEVSIADIHAADGKRVLRGEAPFSPGGVMGEYGFR